MERNFRPSRSDIVTLEVYIINRVLGAITFFENNEFVDTRCDAGGNGADIVYLYRDENGVVTEVAYDDELYPYCTSGGQVEIAFNINEYIEQVKVYLNTVISDENLKELYKQNVSSSFPNFKFLIS